MVRELSENGREAASRMYGCRGWVLHHNTDLWRMTGAVDRPYCGTWPVANAWLCQHLWDRYLFSGDKKYLEEVYPMMKSASEFFVDFLVRDPNTGYLVVTPSNSPENSPRWIKKKSNLNLGKVFLKKIHVQVFGENMKYLCVGGGKCSKEVSEFFQNMGYYWMNIYASTEMNLPMITTTVKDRFPSDSVGKITAFPEISVRIQNPDANGIGEVQIKTPCHMKGYFRDEKATEEAYEEGYFKTGDRKAIYILQAEVKKVFIFEMGRKSRRNRWKIYMPDICRKMLWLPVWECPWWMLVMMKWYFLWKKVP